MTTEANTADAAKAASTQVASPQPRASDIGVTPDTPANRAAAAAGSEALRRKVEAEELKRKVEAMGDSKPAPAKLDPKNEMVVQAAAPEKAKEPAPTRRTLKQAVDAMDKEILRLTMDHEEKRKVYDRLRMDLATTDQTIAAIKRIREEFE